MKNLKKKLLLSILCVLPLMTSGCNFTITGNVDKDSNESEKNTTNNGNENTNNDNNTTNNLITSDHITNDKIQEVYDMVNFKSASNTNLNYIQSGNLDSLNSKIGVILTHDNNTSKFTSEQENYVKKTYSSRGYINPEFGYVSIGEVISKLNSVFNMNVSKNDITSLDKNSFNYGIFANYVYDSTIDGFFAIYNQMDCSSPGECMYNVEQVYKYTETSDKVVVETLIAFATNSYNGGYAVYTDPSYDLLLADKVNLNEFEFDMEKAKNNGIAKLQYTFTKKDDGSYYFAGVKCIGLGSD